jgi:hypothetical protein|uniref:Mono-ADP-ribosyltransferase C3 n=1 Tax=Siphoviridae sp. ct3r22 TaxID=2825325 RepID=A0A8S5V139_9CAUD|nr:MAG TPA: Mono-ADP-ribosyltransferase C3 [Siphoviridae sp. ct3r22]
MLNGENLKNDIIGSFDDLMKTRRASVGEIRVWSDGKKYIKTLKGWIPTEKASSYSKKDVIWHENKFGENYSEYAGKPKEALDFLIDKKSGQVRNAWERDDIGDIDIVYGKKAFGLRHIIGKHVGITEDGKEKDFKDEKELISTIDKLLREGELIRDYIDENGFRKRILSLGKHTLVITQTIVVDNEDNFKEKRWIVTSYDPTRTMKEKGIKKAISEEIALEKEVIDSHSLSIQRKKDAPLVAYSSPSFSLPKDTTNTNDMQQFMDEIIEKSKKGAPIGTEKTYSNGKTYVKTENGWKPKSGAKKTKKEDDQTEKTSSKVNDVNSYASKASDEQLQAAINDKDASPEIKQAAQEELSKRNPKKEDDGSDKIIDTLQKLLDAQKKGELKLGEEMLNQIKEKLKTLKQKKSESVTEETLNKKLDKLKEDISSKIDEKLDKLNGFKKITQTYVKVDGQTIVLNMKGEDRYKAKKGKFYMESEPKESLVEFKKRVKEAFENKLKESEKEGVQKQEKVEEKINKPVKKMQVFNSAGQLFFGNTTQALEGGSDVEFTKDNVTFRLSSIDKGNDTIYTLKNQDTGEEISWENSLIRLKSKINELTKDDSSKSTTLHFENVEEFKDYVSKRNSAKGNLTEDQLDRFNKVFKELEQNINSIEERNLGFIRNNIKDSNYRYLLDVYAKVNPSMKMAMNKELIKSGCLPIANGMLYSEYNGKDYRHFTEENESKLFYKADRNRTNETEKKALDFYKGEGYVGIREFNLGKSENSQFSQMSSIISSFIDKNPLEDNLVLNRRMDVNTISDINALNQWIGANVGDVIEDKSFTSFSLRQLTNFGDDLQVTLLAKKGDKISNINNPYETEYLAQKNSKYKVIAKGTNSIVVEIV